MAANQNKEMIMHHPLDGMNDPVVPDAILTDNSNHEMKVETGSPEIDAVSSNLIELGEHLTIQEVGEMVDVVRVALDRGMTVDLEAGELSRVDGAGIQLLCVLCKAAQKQQVKVRWGNISTELNHAALQMGVMEVLQLPANG